jgi:hypothetical protein
MSELDQEFDRVAEQINAKLKEAAAALREANRLASEAGLPGLIYTQWTDDDSENEMTEEELEDRENDLEWDGESSPLKIKMDKIDVSDIEGAIESAGWSTSSSYC